MLVLTRKTGEQVAIGGQIMVKVLEVRGDRVRLGIQAPQETSIHRVDSLADTAKYEPTGNASGPRTALPLAIEKVPGETAPRVIAH
jgi:carbon storage regulator CsrA